MPESAKFRVRYEIDISRVMSGIQVSSCSSDPFGGRHDVAGLLSICRAFGIFFLTYLRLGTLLIDSVGTVVGVAVEAADTTRIAMEETAVS